MRQHNLTALDFIVAETAGKTPSFPVLGSTQPGTVELQLKRIRWRAPSFNSWVN
jgi:hypothetical protein